MFNSRIIFDMNKKNVTLIMLLATLFVFVLCFFAMYGIQSIKEPVESVNTDWFLGLNPEWIDLSIVVAFCASIPLYLWFHFYVRPGINP